jgi:integrase
MPKMKLTKHAVDEIQPDSIDKYYWDSEITGLGLKVTPRGRKTFLVQYRPGGRKTPTRKMSIGKYGPVTVQKARKEASQILGLRAEGRDPAFERQQARQRLLSDRFSDIADDYLTKYASQNRTMNETTRIIRKDVLPKWGTRSIHEIGKRDINNLLDTKSDCGSKYMANRLLATLRKLFNWCVSRGIISISPCDGVSAPHREKSRDRILNSQELLSVIHASRKMDGVFGVIVQCLIFTAQRRNEVSDMRWTELDLDQSLWTIPGERTKNEKPHFVHLTEQVKTVVSNMPAIGEFVFTSNGETPFSGFSKAKKRLDKNSGITDWRLHDIRRTVATGMATLGIAPHIADKVLNHQSGAISGVAAVYQRHDFLEERKSALEAWENHVQGLIDGTDRQNVINIRDR